MDFVWLLMETPIYEVVTRELKSKSKGSVRDGRGYLLQIRRRTWYSCTFFIPPPVYTRFRDTVCVVCPHAGG